LNKTEEARFGLEHGHSPVAHGVVCIDFDATIVPWKTVDHIHKRALPGAVKAVRALKKAGYTIVIFTSRLSPTWHKYAELDPQEQIDYVSSTLERLKIPYDFITAEKVPAQWYIDDKAIEYRDNWNEILERVLP
jgi:hypothetical protein